jgi:predicted CXXCH cytochrome family protein
LAVALSGLLVTPALADIRMTRHSLVKGGPDKSAMDAREVCVFCHTPEFGKARPLESPPQWQSSLAKDYSFTIYDDIGRLNLDRPSVGSQSIACLSCHDANQALAVSKTSADHPFGVPYRGALKGRADTVDQTHPEGSTAHIHARKLVALEDFRDASQGLVENRRVWWVSASGITAHRRRNDLPLYTRMDLASGDELPHIECSSCHDPHSPNELFLRVRNGGSALCLTCHTK